MLIKGIFYFDTLLFSPISKDPGKICDLLCNKTAGILKTFLSTSTLNIRVIRGCSAVVSIDAYPLMIHVLCWTT